MAGSNSPLMPYANARILVPSDSSVSLVNGRWVEAEANPYLVKCFLKRIQYTGVSSGSKPIPMPSQLNGEMLPGGSGDQFYYRGYSLEYVQVSPDWDLATSDETGLDWTQMTSQPSWMDTGEEVRYRFGNDPVMFAAKIQRSSGIFGGQGIDQIIYKNMGGVELQLTGGELQN